MYDESQRNIPRAAVIAVFTVIAVLFAVRNLPWHLDDYDQAKQAFTSYEMHHGGSLLYQHTPMGRIATKPPFAGWVSALLHAAGVPWEFAWRLPGFACGALVLAALWRTGSRLAAAGGLVAVAAFAFNLVTPRLVTLVRTDMMLAALIFFTGAICLRKAGGEAWRTRDRWLVATLVLAALMTKGPILFAFLGPAWAAYGWLARRVPGAGGAWPGAWCVLVPLAVFGAWVGWGIATVPEFYTQVVDREFLRRFDTGEEASHSGHPPGYYTMVLCARFLPWSAALLAMLLSHEVRRAFRSDPRLLWLACWVGGGLLCMELVPSKRFDRIFPVFAPLCLLLAAMAGHLPAAWSRAARRATIAVIAAAALMAVIYALRDVTRGFRDNERGLVQFGARAAALSGGGSDVAVIMRRDEGMVMYTGRPAFTRRKDVIKQWAAGTLNWIVMSEVDYRDKTEELPGARLAAVSAPVLNRERYVLVRRE